MGQSITRTMSVLYLNILLYFKGENAMIENVIKTTFDVSIETMKLLQKQTMANVEAFILPAMNSFNANDITKSWAAATSKFFPNVSK